MPPSDKTQELREKIAAARRVQAREEKKKQQTESAGSVSAGAHALRYGAEFGACVFVSILFGLGIDHVLDSRPWGLLIMMLFGLAAGVLGVIRAYRELTAAANPVMSAEITDSQAEELQS